MHIHTGGSLYRTTFCTLSPHIWHSTPLYTLVMAGIQYFRTLSTHVSHTLFTLWRHQAWLDHLLILIKYDSFTDLATTISIWIDGFSTTSILYGIIKIFDHLMAQLSTFNALEISYQQLMSFMDGTCQQPCCHWCYGSGYIIPWSTCTNAFGLSFIKTWFICSLR